MDELRKKIQEISDHFSGWIYLNFDITAFLHEIDNKNAEVIIKNYFNFFKKEALEKTSTQSMDAITRI